MAPGAGSKFGATMLETEVFRKQIHCIEESTCDIVGTFRPSARSFGAPIVTWRPGNCASTHLLVMPLGTEPSSESCNHICQNFASFGLPESFFYQTLQLTSVSEPLGNITYIVG